ncbi:MAG: hypothetical protein HY401_05610 [Elusimicrobia bacterium]|nr:hypothetical protein [Elusimicrobiota bacterium]
MGYELGLAKWMSMSPEEQAAYLKWAEAERAKELEALSYEEAARQLHGLLQWGNSLPIEESPDTPRGLCLFIDPNVKRQTSC